MIHKIVHEMVFFFFQNSPKYISCLHPELELQFQYKVHTSLDVVEEKLSSVGKTSGDVRELYLGLLYSTEEHKMYPLVKSTFKWHKQRCNIFMAINV
jgi:hypothetical protein